MIGSATFQGAGSAGSGPMPPALRTGATIDVHGTGMVLAASTARRVGVPG